MEGLRAVTVVDVDFALQTSDTRTSMKGLPINDTCHGARRKKIYVRLLLSIDRRETTEAAMETVCRKLYGCFLAHKLLTAPDF